MGGKLIFRPKMGYKIDLSTAIRPKITLPSLTSYSASSYALQIISLITIITIVAGIPAYYSIQSTRYRRLSSFLVRIAVEIALKS